MAVRLSHSLFGSGGGGLTPAVILHGLFGSGNNWRTIASKLASETNRLVYILDARNHGETQHTPKMTHDLMSRDTIKFIQDQGLDKAILIGHSMGGKTAMAAALHYPEVIEGLVVVDVSPHKAPGERESTDLIKAMKNLDLSSLTNRREADAVLKNDIKDFSLRQFLLTNLIGDGPFPRGGRPSLRWKVNLEAIERSILTLKGFPEFETTYDRAALFVGGGNSNYITAADIPRIKELFPLATISHIPGAGHWAHIDKPAEFLKLIREFLSNCDSKTNKTDSMQSRGHL